jgi:hypothetical protein
MQVTKLLRLVGLCALFNSAVAAAAPPPDLSGIWTRPLAKGFAVPNELPGVLRNLPRTDATKAKLADYARMVPPNPTGPIDSPGAYCLGAAMPTITILPGGYPMEIIQRPEKITMLYELDRGVRQIFMSSKLDPAELVASRPGYSIGKWQGDTLVVETSALEDTFNGDLIFPHTEQAVITERYRMTKDAQGNKLLNLEMTMTDPESYSKPVQLSTQLSFVPNGRLLDYECEIWEQRLESLRAKAQSK